MVNAHITAYAGEALGNFVRDLASHFEKQNIDPKAYANIMMETFQDLGGQSLRPQTQLSGGLDVKSHSSQIITGVANSGPATYLG